MLAMVHDFETGHMWPYLVFISTYFSTYFVFPPPSLTLIVQKGYLSHRATFFIGHPSASIIHYQNSK